MTVIRFQPNANNTNFVNIDAQHQRSSGPVPREIRSSNNPQHVDTNSNNRRRRTLSPQMQVNYLIQNIFLVLYSQWFKDLY
ncbi:hypothetical protein NQ314_020232 [Rhamnusium bicolor]|uniref:Uncharacterized protein n=1 Tax=Rhamnusium bicolor TaxID=1586634 RepID=A0AAV8WLU5_9CUCU|nr:hypothetical protein NQ314_020232 [Rhamnusium bicolor]